MDIKICRNVFKARTSALTENMNAISEKRGKPLIRRVPEG